MAIPAWTIANATSARQATNAPERFDRFRIYGPSFLEWYGTAPGGWSEYSQGRPVLPLVR